MLVPFLESKPSLASLALDKNRIRNDGGQKLLSVLPDHPGMTTFSMMDNSRISDPSMKESFLNLSLTLAKRKFKPGPDHEASPDSTPCSSPKPNTPQFTKQRSGLMHHRAKLPANHASAEQRIPEQSIPEQSIPEQSSGPMHRCIASPNAHTAQSFKHSPVVATASVGAFYNAHESARRCVEVAGRSSRGSWMWMQLEGSLKDSPSLTSDCSTQFDSLPAFSPPHTTGLQPPSPAYKAHQARRSLGNAPATHATPPATPPKQQQARGASIDGMGFKRKYRPLTPAQQSLFIDF
eukprot:gene14555-20596_t